MTEPGAVVGSWELTRSIIYDCPALRMPQTWRQQLGATAQIVVLKWADDATAAHILAALNATPQPPAPVPAVPLTEAARDVLAERRRQIEVEGWTHEYDDQYADGVIARAAACYADPRDAAARWPWDWKWWKPGDRRRMLIKAGALLLAEIERLDRAHNITGAPDHG